MQQRMKTHQLSEPEIEALFLEAQVGRLATLNSDGFPYITPVHFVYCGGRIYIHGLIRGQKIDNIRNDPRVCFEIDRMDHLIPHELPCEVNTAYQSIVAFGTASMVEEEERKIEILKAVVEKYMPGLSGRAFPENMLKGTGIIEISVAAVTGKYYR